MNKMAAKKTKAEKQALLAEIPVHPLTLVFTWVLNNVKNIISIDGVKVDTLPKTVTQTITVERLKGVAFNSDIITAFSFIGREMIYEMGKVQVYTSKVDAPIQTTWSTLSKTENAVKWLLSNSPKLYLTAQERILSKSFVDRNFTELCGAFISKDVSKVYGSTSMVQSAKADIKDVRIIQKGLDETVYSGSPLRSLKNSLLAIEGAADYLSLHKEAQKLKRDLVLPKQVKLL